MPFDPEFEAQYIRQFAAIVRSGTTSPVYNEWTQRIRESLSEIGDPNTKEESLKRLTLIGNYASIRIEDPTGSRNLIADKIEELATFISEI